MLTCTVHDTYMKTKTNRFTVNLEPEERERLNAAARLYDVSAASLVRQAIKAVIRRPDRFLPGVHDDIMRDSA